MFGQLFKNNLETPTWQQFIQQTDLFHKYTDLIHLH